jgi:GT2 family glycosyltransferase/glycosyltransferase involved in cell wall biosynthesis
LSEGAPERIHGAIGLPAAGERVAGWVRVAGWAAVYGGQVRATWVTLDGSPLGFVGRGLERPDVAAELGWCPVAVGYDEYLPLDPELRGRHDVGVLVQDDHGRVRSWTVPVEVEPAPRPSPTALLERAELAQGWLALEGWASAIPESWLDVVVDGTVIGQAWAGAPRPDAPRPGALGFRVFLRGGRPGAVVRVEHEGRPLAEATIAGAARPPDAGATLPPVSIVIPVHGRSGLTDGCLAAVADTLPAAFRGEVVVVDDASPDDTAAVLERWTAKLPLRVVRHEVNRGFVDSCNDGARAATGDVLVFLNNDALVLPGWLPAMLETLRLPDAGAVGGRLLHPDGRLQEAGGAVFRDATAWNLGRDEARPDDPPWDHVRPVDYCSAALLGTPRELFLELGGFDERYRPAYYEDTDYAFALRRAGRRVYCQPAAVAVHAEGGTAGRDVGTGIKAFQERNRERFAAKWAGMLAAQPPPPAALLPALGRRLARRGRRVLVVCPDTPRWDAEGGARRLLHLVKMMMADGWRVTVLIHYAGSARHERELRAMGVEVVPGPATVASADRLPVDPAVLLSESAFDLALLAFWHVADIYLPILRRHAPTLPVVVDSVDLAFLRTARQRATEGGLTTQDGEDFRRELNAYAAADLVWTVSHDEARLLETLLQGRVRARTVPDAEDVQPSAHSLVDRRGVVFIGNFRHAPNVDAASWLCGEIWPRVSPALREKHPLLVVGGHLSEGRAAALAEAPHTRVVGWVPSVEPYLHEGRASVVPLRFGAGTKRKLVQSLMARTPVITTTIGIEGLGLADGDGIRVADDPASFAAALERVLEDDGEWERLAAAGRPRVVARHDPALVASRLREVIAELLGRSPRSAATA